MPTLRLTLAFSVLAGLLLAACGGDEADSAGAVTDAPQANAVSTATTAPATAPPAESEAEADLAPELGSIDGWYNAEPVSLEALRGQPVLLVFWADF